MGVFGVCRTDTCTFSNFRIYPGHGVTYIRVDGKVNPFIIIFCSLHSVRGVNLRIGVWVCGGRWTARRIGAPCPAGLGSHSVDGFCCCCHAGSRATIGWGYHYQVPLRRSDSILERALIALCVMDSRRSWMPWLGCCSWGNRGLGNVTQRMVAGNCCSSVHVCVTPGGLALTSSKCVLAVVPFH